jgi:hypothetical protein
MGEWWWMVDGGSTIDGRMDGWSGWEPREVYQEGIYILYIYISTNHMSTVYLYLLTHAPWYWQSLDVKSLCNNNLACSLCTGNAHGYTNVYFHGYTHGNISQQLTSRMQPDPGPGQTPARQQLNPGRMPTTRPRPNPGQSPASPRPDQPDPEQIRPDPTKTDQRSRILPGPSEPLQCKDCWGYHGLDTSIKSNQISPIQDQDPDVARYNHAARSQLQPDQTGPARSRQTISRPYPAISK